jgi:hypothetical protein
MGILRIVLDPGTPGEVTVTRDLYNATTLYQQSIWSSGLITPGDHTVRIERTGTPHPGATGTSINIDAVVVTGTLR